MDTNVVHNTLIPGKSSCTTNILPTLTPTKKITNVKYQCERKKEKTCEMRQKLVVYVSLSPLNLVIQNQYPMKTDEKLWDRMRL